MIQIGSMHTIYTHTCEVGALRQNGQLGCWLRLKENPPYVSDLAQARPTEPVPERPTEVCVSSYERLQVRLTPHVAAFTPVPTAAAQMAENYRAVLAGEAVSTERIVDRDAGY